MHKYKAVRTVAEVHSITSAAEKLGYTQSGISHQIKAVEQELGLPLLRRTRHGAELTEAGAALLPTIEQLLEAEQALLEQAALLRKEFSGSFTVGTFSSAMLHWLPEILTRFSRRYPEVKISVVNDNYSAIVASLLNDAVDCGFVTLPADPQLKVWPLRKDPMVAVLHEEDALCGFSELTAQQLAERTLIVPAEGMNYDIGKFFSQAGLSPKSHLQINDDYSAVTMVKNGLGFTILPQMLVDMLPMDGLRAVPLKDFQREIGIAVKESHYLSPVVEAFVSCVRAVLKER